MALLTNEGINLAVEDIGKHLAVAGVDASVSYQAQLISEEVLLEYQKLLGSGTSYRLQLKESLCSRSVVLEVQGKEHDALHDEPEISEGNLLVHLLEKGGVKSSYSYHRGVNYISLSVERALFRWKVSFTTQILLAMLLGGLLAFIGMALLPDKQDMIIKEIISPLTGKISSLLKGVSCYFIFFSLLSTMCAISDAISFRQIGVALCKRFLYCSLMLGLVGIALGPYFFTYGEEASRVQGAGSVGFLLNAIPTNPLACLVTGDTLQVTILALFLGLVLLMLESKVLQVRELLTEIDLIFSTILKMSMVLIVPMIVLCAYKMVVTMPLSSIEAYGRFIAYLCVCHAVICVVFLCWALWQLGPQNFVKVVRTFKDVAIISAATASSVTALPARLEAYKKLKIERNFFAFYIPFSPNFIATSSLYFYMGAALYSAELYGYAVTTFYAVLIVILALQCNIAEPKVTGGFIIAVTMMLGAVGSSLDLVGPITACVFLTAPLRVSLSMLERDILGVECALKLGFVGENSPLKSHFTQNSLEK